MIDLDRVPSIGFINGERVYRESDLRNADVPAESEAKPDESVMQAVRAFEHAWGCFQEGDCVRGRDGTTWQLRGGKLYPVHFRRTPDPNGAHAI